MLQKLHQPIPRVLSLAIILVVICVLVIGRLIMLRLEYKQMQTTATQQSQALLLHPHITPRPHTVPTPFATPTVDLSLYILNHFTVDTSHWKTYRDWKYGYSLKLPPEFASYLPTKGYTGTIIDPEGNGFVQFEDTTLSGGYPYRTFLYGFSFRLEPGTPYGKSCATDQECFDLINKGIGRADVFLLRSKILNRIVNGVATVSIIPNDSNIRLGGHDVQVYYHYLFAVNGQPFTVEIDFYYPDSFQETQRQQPTINAILSSISFPNQ